jgi:hypothetical protein
LTINRFVLSGRLRASCALFFESLLLLWVELLVPRASRLELYLAASEKLTDAVRVRVLDAALAQEPMSLRDGCHLTPLDGFLEFFEGFGANQLLATALFHPAFEQILESTLFVGGKPPLALAPRVAQSLSAGGGRASAPRREAPRAPPAVAMVARAGGDGAGSRSPLARLRQALRVGAHLPLSQARHGVDDA